MCSSPIWLVFLEEEESRTHGETWDAHTGKWPCEDTASHRERPRKETNCPHLGLGFPAPRTVILCYGSQADSDRSFRFGGRGVGSWERCDGPRVGRVCVGNGPPVALGTGCRPRLCTTQPACCPLSSGHTIP